MDADFDDRVAALADGRAFVRPRAQVVAVRGDDAERWLNDLVTTGVARLRPGESARSLLLSPTGRIRAAFDVLRMRDGFLLIQFPDQPEPVDAILAPYVLSSAVELAVVDARPTLVTDGHAWRATLDPPSDAVEVEQEAFERWRIERAIAVFPVDLDPDSLPAEAGLDVPPVTDTGKGCFLGQESVARIRNLGHPTRLVIPLEAAEIAAGAVVRTADGADVGVVTSANSTGAGRTVLLARIRWDARETALLTESGVALRPR
jgi:folate-binding protein YgfZ